MDDLIRRLRHYGDVLDEAAERRAIGAGGDGPARAVPQPEHGARRPMALLAAAAVLVVLGASVIATRDGDRLDVRVGSPSGGPTSSVPVGRANFAPRPHSDMSDCLEGARRTAPDLPGEEANATCLLALAGTVIGEGRVGGQRWELVASQEPDGRWVSLRGPELQGTMRGSFAAPPTSDPLSMFVSLGPCCRLGEATLFVAVVRADVVSVRARRGDSVVADTATVADPGTPGVRFAVLAVRGTEPVSIEFEGSDGTRFEPVVGRAFDPASTGG